MSDDEEILKANIRSAMRDIELYHNYQFKPSSSSDVREKEREQVVTLFAKGESHLLELDKLFAVPYFGTHNMLVTIVGNYVTVNAVDASHVASLSRIFNWYMV